MARPPLLRGVDAAAGTVQVSHVRFAVCMFCMYVLCMYVLYVCMYVLNLLKTLSLCMYCMYVCMYCMYVLYVCTVCMYVLYVFMYCMYVCTVCIYVLYVCIMKTFSIARKLCYEVVHLSRAYIRTVMHTYTSTYVLT